MNTLPSPEVSIIIPPYNEEVALPAPIARLYPALDALNASYEVVFINDGSPATVRPPCCASSGRGEPIKLIDGGHQMRSFTYVSDGIDALMKIVETIGGEYYGEGHQDTQHRVPKIANTMADLDWAPKVGFEEALRGIFEAYRTDVAAARELMD